MLSSSTSINRLDFTGVQAGGDDFRPSRRDRATPVPVGTSVVPYHQEPSSTKGGMRSCSLPEQSPKPSPDLQNSRISQTVGGSGRARDVGPQYDRFRTEQVEFCRARLRLQGAPRFERTTQGACQDSGARTHSLPLSFPGRRCSMSQDSTLYQTAKSEGYAIVTVLDPELLKGKGQFLRTGGQSQQRRFDARSGSESLPSPRFPEHDAGCDDQLPETAQGTRQEPAAVCGRCPCPPGS